MRLALLLSASLLAQNIFAQGPQQLVNVPTCCGGGTVPAWLYLPADYNQTTRNYPVVFFYHGSGEAGTNPNKVLNHGIPKLIAQGMRPDSIINPLDGQQYSFIVLSPQHWSWSPDPQWLPQELEWLKQNYRIDTNRVYVTGLSAGGQASFHAATYDDNISRLVTSVASFSLPAPDNPDITMLSTYHIKSWFLSGATDPFTTNAQNFNNQANAVYPGSSKLNIYPGGHCCWETYYNKTWHDTITGLSIWEWFLTGQRQSFQTLPVKFTDLKVTDLGDKKIKVSFTYEGADGDESFYIRLWIDGVQKDIFIKPEDKIAPNKYSKIINLIQ